MSATATDALLVLYNALTREEQDVAYERVTAQRLSDDAATEDDMARYLRSLRRVADHLGHVPTTTEYKKTSAELIANGEDLESFTRVYVRFGSWRRVTEALGLVEVNSPRRIEARFKLRRHGRPYRFTEAQLVEAMHTAAAKCDGPPTTTDYMWWRREELERANALGEHHLLLPSLTAFRRVWTTWREALLGSGFTEQEVFDRLGRVKPVDSLWLRAREKELTKEMPAADLDAEATGTSQLTPVQTQALLAAWLELPHRTKHVVTAHLGLLDKPAPYTRMGERLGVVPTRVGQVYRDGLDVLTAAVEVAGGSHDCGERTTVEAALRELVRRSG